MEGGKRRDLEKFKSSSAICCYDAPCGGWFYQIQQFSHTRTGHSVYVKKIKQFCKYTRFKRHDGQFQVS